MLSNTLEKSINKSVATFAREKLRKENLQIMDRAVLRELGITAMGEALYILSAVPHDLRRDYMDIRAFHCSQVAKVHSLNTDWLLVL